MDAAVRRRLNELNREFYDAHAEAFADSRPRLAPGIRRVLAHLAPGARVLEVGCGDGKVGRWLRRNVPDAVYWGIDSSVGMLERAKRYSRQPSAVSYQPSAVSRQRLNFVQADLTAPDWPRGLPAEPFDWALAFAVLHHIPGRAARAEVLRTLAAHLSPGGALALSNWQFTRSARLLARVAPWSTLELAEGAVEPGDYLLTWERAGRRGLRYVLALDEAEARALAAEAGLTVTEVFQSDGGSGALADYALLSKSG